MLTVADVDVFIQTSHILRHVSLEVGAREVICLVGRNGSGKTTTLRTIMGYLRPRVGRVEFRGQPIHGRRTHEIALLGLGWPPRTPPSSRISPSPRTSRSQPGRGREAAPPPSASSWPTTCFRGFVATWRARAPR